jgi:hypothetical protein
MRNETREPLRYFGGPHHGKKSHSTAQIIRVVMPVNDSEYKEFSQREVAFPEVKVGTYTRACFARQTLQKIDNPRFDPCEIGSAQQPKIYCIDKSFGYVYLWNWYGESVEMSPEIEALISWGETKRRIASPDEFREQIETEANNGP